MREFLWEGSWEREFDLKILRELERKWIASGTGLQGMGISRRELESKAIPVDGADLCGLWNRKRNAVTTIKTGKFPFTCSHTQVCVALRRPSREFGYLRGNLLVSNRFIVTNRTGKCCWITLSLFLFWELDRCRPTLAVLTVEGLTVALYFIFTSHCVGWLLAIPGSRAQAIVSHFLRPVRLVSRLIIAMFIRLIFYVSFQTLLVIC